MSLTALFLVTLLSTSASSSPPQEGLGRSDEILRLDCRSQLARRELTLFGNGTARLRSGPLGEEQLRLFELDPGERDAIVDRLREIDLSEAESSTLSAGGSWVEICALTVELPGAAPISRSFARYDSLPLALSRVRELAVALGDRVEEAGRAAGGLPPGYRARRGDCLRRVDGHLFRVLNYTSDGKGVELEGVDQPLTVYVVADELDREYLELVTDGCRP
ncbi:MAG TPA: hypothetical protein PK570_03940 [Thermoanaerobaculia bacterium]|jgi:hypothetical protein|nr:MAG: hypothetical protein BWX64_01127 [Acidobacteria bacterium ADurb.Bin051]HNZ96572.1 hypothetical protein [Thermoanaerobaculia bacterium]HQP93094.1 hypothetical protein [Thermoanaerobaculia bacterium]